MNILRLIRERPSLNVHVISTNNYVGYVSAVPTLILEDGSKLVGSAAFDYIQTVECVSTEDFVRLAVVVVLSYITFQWYQSLYSIA
jgi:hypothetical protein